MAKKKDKKWIQKASADIKKRGTEGVCTGPKFGGPTCPEGSKRYNLAKVFKGMAKKKKKAAWGSMIHANTGQLVREPTRGVGAAVTGNQHYVMQGMDAAQTGKLIQVPTRGTGEAVTGNKHYVMQGMDAAKHGKIIKAKTSAFAANPDAWKKARGAATTGMKTAGAGTAYTSSGWKNKITKSLNKFKDMMKLGTKSTAMSAAINPSKWTGKIPKPSQLKTLAKTGGRRSLLLMGGPMGAAAAAATLTPGVIEKLTKRAPGATKTKLFGIDLKGAEKSARTREALMAKRNKARNAKTGTMVRAAQGIEVLGKQQVPFKIEPASANLAEQRQGRKGAAVTGFDFKGVR